MDLLHAIHNLANAGLNPSPTAAAASPSASRISLNLVSCLQLFRFRRVMCLSGGMASIPGGMQGNAEPFS